MTEEAKAETVMEFSKMESELEITTTTLPTQATASLIDAGGDSSGSGGENGGFVADDETFDEASAGTRPGTPGLPMSPSQLNKPGTPLKQQLLGKGLHSLLCLIHNFITFSVPFPRYLSNLFVFVSSLPLTISITTTMLLFFRKVPTFS